jgi:hypothetical protein
MAGLVVTEETAAESFKTAGARPSACHCSNNSTAGSTPPLQRRSACSHQSLGNPIASNTSAISGGNQFRQFFFLTSFSSLPDHPQKTHPQFDRTPLKP